MWEALAPGDLSFPRAGLPSSLMGLGAFMLASLYCVGIGLRGEMRRDSEFPATQREHRRRCAELEAEAASLDARIAAKVSEREERLRAEGPRG